MKRFITFALCFILCLAPLVLTACGSDKPEKVNTSIDSVGNGGTVVTRGDYVYFVNGYTSYSVFDKKNLDKNFSVGGLYRTKLNELGEIVRDDAGNIQHVEHISDNLVGFESTSLYVFGDHIYYVTPTTEVTKKGELQTSKLDFCRVGIGGGKAETIYQSGSDASSVKFEYYYVDGNVYLLVKDGTTLKRVKATGKKSTNTIATDVTSLAWHRDTNNVFDNDSYSHIYYTKTNSDGKIEIYNYNILSNREEYKKVTDYKTCELVDYKFGHLYYKASKNDALGWKLYYRVDATKNAITSLSSSEEQLTSDDSYTKFYLLSNESAGYIAQDGSNTYHIKYNANGLGEVKDIADSMDIIAINNNIVYYKSGDDIKCIDCNSFTGTKTEQTVATLKNMQSYSYDIDDGYLYIYATQGGNTYLYSIKIGNVLEDEKVEPKILGVYQSGDAPKTEE